MKWTRKYKSLYVFVVMYLLWVCKIYNVISFKNRKNSPEHDSTQGFNALTAKKKKKDQVGLSEMECPDKRKVFAEWH